MERHGIMRWLRRRLSHPDVARRTGDDSGSGDEVAPAALEELSDKAATTELLMIEFQQLRQEQFGRTAVQAGIVTVNFAATAAFGGIAARGVAADHQSLKDYTDLLLLLPGTLSSSLEMEFGVVL